MPKLFEAAKAKMFMHIRFVNSYTTFTTNGNISSSLAEAVK